MSYGMQLTNLGRELLAKALLGKELKFSKMALGAGDFDYNKEKVSNLTMLRDLRLNMPLVGKKIAGDGLAEISAQLCNFDLEEGFCAKETGLYALDPDTGEELLYAYQNAGDEYSFIPAKTGSVKKDVTLACLVEIQDAPNVTISVDFDFAYVSQKDFESHLSDEHPHPNLPNYYGDVSETDYLWGTAADNHLHKISLSNLRHLLKTENQPTEKIDFETAQRILGLEANVLYHEDFTDSSNLDKNILTVTSCARGSKIIGLETIDNLKVGGWYIIADGIKCEPVKVAAIARSYENHYATLTETLSNDYDSDAVKLFRSSFLQGAAENRYLEWRGETFSGYPANIARTQELDTSQDNRLAFIIEGDGILTKDGFFTIRN